MTAALQAGARLVNDVSALTFDPRSAEIVAAAGAPVILMHHLGSPETMQQDPRYDDVLVEVYVWLEERIAAAEAAGIARSRILIDPGFGFGKTVAHNLELMNGLALLHSLGCPIVARREPQADHRRAVRRGAGRRTPAREHRLRAQGGRAGRADRPRPRRSARPCRRSGSGAAFATRL